MVRNFSASARRSAALASTVRSVAGTAATCLLWYCSVRNTTRAARSTMAARSATTIFFTIYRPASGKLSVLAHLLMQGGDLQNLQLPRPGGKAYRDGLTGLVVQQGPAQWGGYRDVAGVHVHGVRDHQLEGLPLLGLGILHLHPRAQPHPVPGHLGEIDLRQLGQAGPEMAQPGVHELLALQRGVIVAVLAEVALLEGLLERLRQGHVQLVVELLHFLRELLLDLFNHELNATNSRVCAPEAGGSRTVRPAARLGIDRQAAGQPAKEPRTLSPGQRGQTRIAPGVQVRLMKRPGRGGGAAVHRTP